MQSSLTILEDRYRELREIGEKRFEAWEKEKGKAQQAVEELRKQLKATQQELNETSKDAELVLLQLHQVKEELEQFFIAEQQKGAALQSAEQQIESLQNQLEQGTNASEEAELTLVQLLEVQDELKHYLLRSKNGDQLVDAQQHQLARAQSLMGRLLAVASQSNSMYRESLDVITPDVMSQSHMSVQTDALLSSYQKSLHRAAALLQRALRS